MITRVEVTRFAYKQLERAPLHVRAKLLAWVDAVEDREIRVGAAGDSYIELVQVQEVHAHDY